MRSRSDGCVSTSKRTCWTISQMTRASRAFQSQVFFSGSMGRCSKGAVPDTCQDIAQCRHSQRDAWTSGWR